MPTVTCEQLAVCKILGHAAKHLSNTVCGILLGKLEDSDKINVVDVIPLFHASTGLAMPTEVALAQIQAFCSASKDKHVLVGYYHSDARLGSSDLPASGRRIADRIWTTQGGAVALVLDNKKLQTFMAGENNHPFDLYTRSGTTAWAKDQSSNIAVSKGNWTHVLENIKRILQQRLHTTVTDFDDHFDDVSKDWLNPQLESLGKLALPGQA